MGKPSSPSQASASPASSPVAIPALRLEDLPERPRPISLALRLGVLFGSPLHIGLWAAAAFGLLLLVPLASSADMRDHSSDPQRGTGRVTDVQHHKPSIGASYDVVTAHAVIGGVDRSVVTIFSRDPPSQGAVTIVGDDDHLLIAGGRLRSGKASDGWLPIGILALMAALYIGTFLSRVPLIGVLRNGAATTALLTRRREVRVKNGVRYELTFTFTDEVGRERTHVEDHATAAITDDPRGEPLLSTERHSALLDSLPGLPQLEGGRFVPRSPNKTRAVAAAGVAGLFVWPALVALAWAVAHR